MYYRRFMGDLPAPPGFPDDDLDLDEVFDFRRSSSNFPPYPFPPYPTPYPYYPGWYNPYPPFSPPYDWPYHNRDHVPPQSLRTQTRTSTYTEDRDPVPPSSLRMETGSSACIENRDPVPSSSLRMETGTSTYRENRDPVPPSSLRMETGTSTYAENRDSVPPQTPRTETRETGTSTCTETRGKVCQTSQVNFADLLDESDLRSYLTAKRAAASRGADNVAKTASSPGINTNGPQPQGGLLPCEHQADRKQNDQRSSESVKQNGCTPFPEVKNRKTETELKEYFNRKRLKIAGNANKIRFHLFVGIKIRPLFAKRISIRADAPPGIPAKFPDAGCQWCTCILELTFLKTMFLRDSYASHCQY